MRRLHPLVAVRRAVGYAVNLAGAAVLLVGFVLPAVGVDAGDAFALLPAGVAAGALFGLLSYLRFRYEVTDDTVDVNSGVVSRREREIPLDRIQNVDVERSVWQRLLGVATLRVETAGGGSTEATLDFVSADEAERVRALLRAEARPAEVTPEAPAEEPLFALRPRELAVYAATEFRPGALALTLFGLPVVGRVATDALLAAAAPLGGPERLAGGSLTPDEALALAAVGLPALAAGGWLLGAALALNEQYGFTLVRSGEDVQYSRGLLTTYSGAIPVERIQTLTIRENVVQRALGYGALTIDTAGYAGEEGAGRRSAIPMAERERVTALADEVAGVTSGADFERPPTRARRRYLARYAVAVGLLTVAAFAVSRRVGGFSLWWTAALLFVAVPPAAHLKWRHRGYAVRDDHLLVRAGFWTRRTTVVPYERLQTVQRRATLFQRRRGLGSVVADTASGAVLRRGGAVVHDVDAGDASALSRRLRDALDTAIR
ncbi:MAG: PH domain-containing protein [Halobacteriaceae archaeon]